MPKSSNHVLRSATHARSFGAENVTQARFCSPEKYISLLSKSLCYVQGTSLLVPIPGAALPPTFQLVRHSTISVVFSSAKLEDLTQPPIVGDSPSTTKSGQGISDFEYHRRLVSVVILGRLAQHLISTLRIEVPIISEPRTVHLRTRVHFRDICDS